MRHGSLFSGIGGFDLAAQWAGWQNIFQCEKDEYCLAVLNKNFPNVKRFGDIKTTSFKNYLGDVDVLSGGFPCQPFSQAGKQKGVDDDRYLWPEYERAIDEIRPRWVVGENVTGIKNMALDLVCSSLEGKGYAVRPVIIPASAVGAWHRRERIWIVANAVGAGGGIREQPQGGRDTKPIDNSCAENCQPTDIDCERLESVRRLQNMDCEDATQSGPEKYRKDDTKIIDTDYRVADLDSSRLQGSSVSREQNPRKDSARDYWSFYWPEIVADFCRNNDGVPARMDRIKSLGNAIVPQVALEIFQIINEIEAIK